MKITNKNKIQLDSNLTRWAQKYQPELLEMLLIDWRALIKSLIEIDLYEVLKILENNGWKPNGWLLKAITDVSE